MTIIGQIRDTCKITFNNLIICFFRILQLDQHLMKLIQEEQFEMALPLASLFITFGESHSRMLLGNFDFTILLSTKSKLYLNQFLVHFREILLLKFVFMTL